MDHLDVCRNISDVLYKNKRENDEKKIKIDLFKVKDYCDQNSLGNYTFLKIAGQILKNAYDSGYLYNLLSFKKEFEEIAVSVDEFLKDSAIGLVKAMKFKSMHFENVYQLNDEMHDYCVADINAIYGLATAINEYADADEGICIETRYEALKLEKVVFNGPATIAFWNDGTKTIVKKAEQEEDDREKAIALCFMKKMLGNTSKMRKVFDKCISEETEETNSEAAGLFDNIRNMLKEIYTSE